MEWQEAQGTWEFQSVWTPLAIPPLAQHAFAPEHFRWSLEERRTQTQSLQTLDRGEERRDAMMHMLGNPQNMQDSPKYKDVVIEVIKFLSQRIKIARDFGIVDLIADPGFGFGKTTENNFEILNNLEKFKILDVPLLTGFSRKSMIYKTLNTTSKNALNGTSSLNTIALTKGAKILRVHDVKEAKECIILYEKTISSLFD